MVKSVKSVKGSKSEKDTKQFDFWTRKENVVSIPSERQQLQRDYASKLRRLKSAEQLMLGLLSDAGHDDSVLDMGEITEALRTSIKQTYETDKILLEKRLKKQQRHAESFKDWMKSP